MTQTVTSNVVKHLFGLKSAYDASQLAYGIYFATDTKEIILNGDIYGYNSAEHKEISSVEWDAATDSLMFTYSDGTTSSVSVPAASADADGLLSVAGFAKLDGIEEGAQENVIETVQVNGTALEVTDKTVNVVIPDETLYEGKEAISVSDYVVSLGIDSSDVVLSQSTSGLKTTLSVDYTSDDHKINLKGIDGAVISSFDASEFVYDGMIQDVELVNEDPTTGATGEFIKIVWNLEGGETKTIYLDVTELVDVYTAGNGIAISDENEVSVKIADSSEDFLTVTEAGLKVSGIQDAINAAVAEAEKEASAAHTVLSTDDSALHLTLSSEIGSDGETIYTLGESNIASASDLSSLSDKVDANTADIATNANGIADNASAIETLKDEVAALEAASVEVVGDDDHISVEPSTADSKTTYTVKGSDIASAVFVGSFNDAADAGTVCAAITKNEEAISTLETAVETLEAKTVTVKAEDEEKHIVVTSNTDENGATTYTLSSSDVASAALVGEFSDTSYEGTVCAAVEGIANSLMWVEVE